MSETPAEVDDTSNAPATSDRHPGQSRSGSESPADDADADADDDTEDAADDTEDADDADDAEGAGSAADEKADEAAVSTETHGITADDMEQIAAFLEKSRHERSVDDLRPSLEN